MNKTSNINNKFLSKKPYPMKSHYNTVIPLNIFQTWHTKHLPQHMLEAVNLIKQTNPAFTHHLFDDDDCRNFIEQYFTKDILNAYDALVPGAYKADLWRYCVLYKKGGIYLDIKYKPLNGFKMINLTEKEHFVLDIDKYGVYNALMVCAPNNIKLKYAICKIVQNVKNKYYGESSLEPTGPFLLGKLFKKEEKIFFDMYHDCYLNDINNKFIFYKNYNIFQSYLEYKNEQNSSEKTPHYSILWHNKNIYK